MKKMKEPVLCRRSTRGRDKAGSSMALVMIITAALVIWAMALAPLMTNTGKQALNVQIGYTEYLGSRGAIEFAKGHLEYVVQTESPYTFAVLRETVSSNGEESTEYSVVRKRTATGGVEDEYSSYVDAKTDYYEDTLDVPRDNSDGDKVAAICAITPPQMTGNQYTITISTYHEGEPGLSYNATFTMKGSLMINPESYRQKEALPLSDFVLVDGVLGGKTDAEGNWVENRVWESTITVATAKQLYSIRENFLPFQSSDLSEDAAALDGYADAGEYPAVFKTTVEAALDDESHEIGDPVEDLPTDDTLNWYMPTSSTEQKGGAMKLGDDNRTVFLWEGSWKDVTELCTVLYNGNSAYPSAPGYYRVTVDFRGTGEYDAMSVYNTLPCRGLDMGNISIKLGSKYSKPTNGEIEAVTYTPAVTKKENGVDVTTPAYADVTLSAEVAKGTILYGYSTSDDSDSVVWSTSSTIRVNNTDKTYFFFCATASGPDSDGVFHEASDVEYIGMVYPYTYVSSNSLSGQYLMLNSNGYAMLANGDELKSEKVAAAGKPGAGLLYNTPDNMIWEVSGNSIRNVGDYGDLKLAKSNGSDRFDVYKTGSGCDSQRRNFYLHINDGSVSAPDSKSSNSVYFVLVPTEPDYDVSAPYGGAYTSNAEVSGIKTQYPEITTVYANGSEVTGDLKPGYYHLTGTLADGSLVSLGTADIGKYSLNDTPSVAVDTANSNDAITDDHIVVLTSSGWDNNGGVHYYGYQTVSGSSSSAIKWYTSTEDTITLRLPYGSYKFLVSDGGNSSYNGAQSTTVSVTLSAKSQSFTANDFRNVYYHLDTTGTTPTITWYGDLPDGFQPSKVTKIVYGKRIDNCTYYNKDTWSSWNLSDILNTSNYPTGTVYLWSDTPIDGYNIVGIEITGNSETFTNNFEDLIDYNILGTHITFAANRTKYQKVVPLPGSLATTHVAGHQSSMMSGKSLYFMGGGEDGNGKSINTFGNDIFLKADLLVLNSSITSSMRDEEGNRITGRVTVEPYSTEKTLLFAVHDIYPDGGAAPVFEAHCLYAIEPGSDIYNPVPSNYTLVGKLDYDDITEFTKFKDALRNGYPKLNLDIAYADEDQLSRIISSETMGWTDKGLLSGSSSSTNPDFAVCTFVNRVSGTTSYKANRILLAAADNHLTVPYNVTFYTRYLSLDTTTLEQGSSSPSFVVWNLAQDEDFIQWIASALSITNYSSKSLQVDFEETISIVNSSGGTTVYKPQISRYEDGADLFDPDTAPIELMAEYTTDEINGLFSNGIFSWLSSAVKIVDRYIALKPSSSGTGVIDIYAALNLDLDIYTNYLYVDPAVTTIRLDSAINNISFTISSQENGYTTDEYLGWFKGHSADAYSGTLMYFGGQVEIVVENRVVNTIPKGFYYVPASDADGVALTDFDWAAHTIDPEMLQQYSIYIDPYTGKINDAYVDTGLEDSSPNMGGFSGGMIE